MGPASSPNRLLVATLALLCLIVIPDASSQTTQGPQDPPTQTSTFAPVADAYANSINPKGNFGIRTSIRTDASPYVASFLRFDPDGVGAIHGAVLRVFANSANSVGIHVRGVTTNDWSEAALTYQNMPGVLSVTDSSGPITAGTWLELDITSLVSGNDPVSFALTSTSVTATNLASRESINRPQLVVSSGGSPVPSEPSPSPSPSSSPTPSPTPTESPSPSPSPSLSPSPQPTPTQSPSPGPSPGAGQPTFPIRAAFYYPWFPNAWNQQGFSPFTQYTPTKGHYDSGDRQLIRTHIAEMLSGRIDAGIASWWGPGHHTDSRIRALLDEAAPTPFRWTLYHEGEGQTDPAVASIEADLSWIVSRYAGHDGYLRVAGRPVLFVYGDPTDRCGVTERWVEANRTHGFYLVLKVFPGYRTCPVQPDSWHQYAPARPADTQLPHAYMIAPGFWKAGEAPRLIRDLPRWRGNVRDMVASGARWQLVVSWNEWGEGTQVEASTQLGDEWLHALATNGAEPAP